MDVDEVMTLLTTELQRAIGALSPAFTAPIVFGEGYPTESFLLQQVASKGSVSITIFDRRPAANVTRWMPFVAVEKPHSTGVTVELSGSPLAVDGEQTITLSGVVNQNDAVALTAFLRGGPSVNGGVSAIAGPQDTPATLAAKLAAAINADSFLPEWMTANATGAVVTLEGTGAQPIQLAVAVGNIRFQKVENARFLRELQIIVYTNSSAARMILGKAIMGDLAQLYANFGLQDDDGEWVRVIPFGDVLNDQDAGRALYRRDILLNAEYGITAEQIAYDILSPRPNLTVEQGA